MKMAVVGCEASGKTVFMCALADYYGLDAVKNPLRIRLTPENSAANSFERYQYRMMRCMKQWPLATSPERTIEMKWSLRQNGNSLAEVEMLEFGGETYRAAFRDDSPDPKQDASAQELLKYLSDADFFVVLVSIKALIAQSDDLANDEYDRETEAVWVTRGILNFIQKNRPDAGVVIGLTQADKYLNELGEAGGPKQLLDAHWPSVAAVVQNLPVVEVASVSKVDDKGNPAEGYHTHGIQPVMKVFAKHCFGDENALENGSKKLTLRSVARRKALLRASAAIVLAALGFGVWALSSARKDDLKREKSSPVANRLSIVTNTVEKIVERPVTNVVEKTVTNTVEKVIERPVTNTVEKIIERSVTNTVEKVVERPITNTVEKVVERIVTNVVAATTSDSSVTNAPQLSETQIPPGYRIWTDYNGRKIIARWTGVAVDESGITIVTRYNRRIDAVLWKFSKEDQDFIKKEIKKHTAQGEVMTDGAWVRTPMFKQK